MKKFFGEFKEFALRGNVMNLAVGVIIGAAFQEVVTSLTDNILGPIIGLFSREDLKLQQFSFFGVNYGAFLATVINFVIMAFVVFLLVRGMNHLLKTGEKKQQDAAPQKDCPYCLTKVNAKATRCPACTSQLEE